MLFVPLHGLKVAASGVVAYSTLILDEVSTENIVHRSISSVSMSDVSTACYGLKHRKVEVRGV